MDLTRINIIQVDVSIDTAEGGKEWKEVFYDVSELREYLQSILNYLNEE